MIKTKRFAYRILANYYDKLEEDVRSAFGVTCYDMGCTTVLGVRKVGKTVLLKQLCSICPERSLYFDCSKINDDFDFEDFYGENLNKGINRIYLDEICRIPDECMADFVSATKYYSAEILITITGSVSGSVRKISRDIGRGRSITLHPITYAERLIWDSGITDDDFLNIDYREVTSYDKYISYLKYFNLKSDSAVIEYVGQLVSDTINSYKKGDYLEGVELPSEEKIDLIIKYISLCQYIYVLKNGSFVSVPALEKKIKNAVEEYSILKNADFASSDEIKAVCALLSVSGLARSVSDMSLKIIGSSFEMHMIDDRIPALIFEYPWFACHALSPVISDSEMMIDVWIENEFLAKASYLYEFADKFRSMNDLELDMIDLIVLALELEYFEQCRKNFADEFGSLYCENTIAELVEKYSLK